MAYARCIECGNRIDKSDYSAEDVINEEHHCQSCGVDNPCHYTLAEMLEDMNSRICSLETNK